MTLGEALHEFSSNIGDSTKFTETSEALSAEIEKHKYIQAKNRLEELKIQRETNPTNNNTYEVFERHYIYQRFWYILIWIGIIISVMLFVRLMKKE